MGGSRLPDAGQARSWVHIRRAIGKANGTYIKLPKSGLARDLFIGRDFFDELEPFRRPSGWLFPGRVVLPRADPGDITATSSAGRLVRWLESQAGRVACESGRAGADARRAIGVNSSTLSQVTSALVRSGHLTKEANARRTFSLELTPSGREAARELGTDTPTDRPLHPDTAAHRFASIVRDLGLAGATGRPYGLHSLRHFVATHLYNRSHDWVQVAKFMGHTSPAITMELYANNVVEDTQALLADEATRLIPRSWRSPQDE